MTPDESKRPLPSSTSMVFPEQPRTLEQWKSALSHVKNLYNRAQWKYCVAQCNHLLSETHAKVHPAIKYAFVLADDQTKPLQLHATYLCFYAASSTETMARIMHTMSISRIQTLEKAKLSYQAAMSSLPAPEPLLDMTDSMADDPFLTMPAPSPPRDSSEATLELPSSPNSISAFSIEPDKHATDEKTLELPPLRIRKATCSGQDPAIYQFAPQHLPTPPYTPSTPHPSQSPPLATADPTTSLNATSIWLHNCALERYNEHLASFSAMLANHICVINNLSQSTRETQSRRFTVRRLASYGEDEQEAKAADVRGRIASLRETGWRRERFQAERYRRLCEVALAEL